MSITATYVRQIDVDNLSDPFGAAVDPANGDLLVMNGNYAGHQIYRYTADGTAIENYYLPGYAEGACLAVDGDGKIWVTNYYGTPTYPRLRRLTSAGADDGTFFGGSWNTEIIEGPCQVAIGPDGKIFVVSNYYGLVSGSTYDFKQKVIRTSAAGVYEATIGTGAVFSPNPPVLGTPSVFPETQADGVFAYPTGVGIDSAGNVYVSDNHQPYRSVSKFSASGTFVSKFGGPGTGDGEFVNSIYGTSGWYQDGMQIAVNDNDRIFVTDRYGQKVNVYDTDGAWLMSFTSADSDGAMLYPVSIACGPDGAVYVGDYWGGVTQWLVTEDAVPEFMVRGISVVVCGDTDC